uniref:TATA element modulatory factor 1 TATA binding domain-containing protein n=1 Tax=Knipowitschia caucasica TaxID=637954 RepID=A0AAV2M993_KNICA
MDRPDQVRSWEQWLLHFQALTTAQKSIDRVLDIKEEEQWGDSAVMPYNDVTLPEKLSLSGGWGLTQWEAPPEEQPSAPALSSEAITTPVTRTVVDESENFFSAFLPPGDVPSVTKSHVVSVPPSKSQTRLQETDETDSEDGNTVNLQMPAENDIESSEVPESRPAEPTSPVHCPDTILLQPVSPVSLCPALEPSNSDNDETKTCEIEVDIDLSVVAKSEEPPTEDTENAEEPPKPTTIPSDSNDSAPSDPSPLTKESDQKETKPEDRQSDTPSPPVSAFSSGTSTTSDIEVLDHESVLSESSASSRQETADGKAGLHLMQDAFERIDSFSMQSLDSRSVSEVNSDDDVPGSRTLASVTAAPLTAVEASESLKEEDKGRKAEDEDEEEDFGNTLKEQTVDEMEESGRSATPVNSDQLEDLLVHESESNSTLVDLYTPEEDSSGPITVEMKSASTFEILELQKVVHELTTRLETRESQLLTVSKDKARLEEECDNLKDEVLGLKEESSTVQSLKDEFTQRIADTERKAQLACKERDIAKKPPLSKPPLSKPPLSKPPLSKPPLSKPPLSKPPLSKPPLSKPPLSKPPLSKPPLSKPPLSKPPLSKPPLSKPPLSKPPLSKPPLSKPPLSKPPLSKPPLSKPPLSKPPLSKPPLSKPPLSKPPLSKPPLSKPPLSKPPLSKPPLSKPPLSKPPLSKPPLSKPPLSKPPLSKPPLSKPPLSKPPLSKPPLSKPPLSKPPLSKPPLSKPPLSKPPLSKPPLLSTLFHILLKDTDIEAFPDTLYKILYILCHYCLEIKGLREELSTRLNSVNTMEIIKEKEEQIRGLLEEGEKLSKQQLQHSNIIKKLRAKEKESDSRILKHEKKMKELEDELGLLQQVLDGKEEVEKQHRENIKKLNAVVEKQEREMSKLQADSEELQETSRSLQSALDNSYRELAELHKANASRASEAEEVALSREIWAKEQLSVSLEKAQEEARAQQEALADQVADLRLALQRAEQQQARKEDYLREEISELQQRLQEAESRNQELSQSVTSATRPLLRQIENLQASLGGQTASWEKLEKSISDRLVEAQAQLAVAVEKERSASDELLNIRSQMVSLESQNSLLRQEKARVLAQLEAEKNKKEKLEDEGSRHLVELENLRGEHSRILEETKKEKLLLTNQLEMERMKVEQEKKKCYLAQESLREKERLQAPPSSTPSLSRSSSISAVDHAGLHATLLSQEESVDGSGGNMSLSLSGSNLYEAARLSGGSSVIENLQSQLKLRDGEITQLQMEISGLERSRSVMAEELVRLTNQNDETEEKVKEIPQLRLLLKDLEQRHNTILQMYGEKAEEAQELRLDLEDVKNMYKTQINELLRNQK